MLNLICPNCKTELIKKEQALICNLCRKDWLIEDGVPILTESSTWYPKEHMTKEQFEKFLEDINSKGWEEAVEIAMAAMEKPKTFQALAFDEARRVLSHFLPVNKNADVLDYGCGVGSISFSLAKSCKSVVSIDQSVFRTKFMKARCKSSGVYNITVICSGNSRYLPFPDGSFDIVVLSGVLEWMPLAMEGNPYKTQTAALKEINRVLKKGGTLYLAIENRFGYRYLLLRKGDSHNQKKRKLRYITVMPRFLANIYSYMAIGYPYRCYLYSYFGLKKMLKASNFISCDFYFPYPDHNNLSYIVPLNNSKTASLFFKLILGNSLLLKKERMALSILEKTGLLKYLAQDYSIIATK